MLVKTKEQLPSFTLSNFEGPLNLLLQLVQRHELEIAEISLREIVSQFLNEWMEKLLDHVDQGAEFISLTATLLLIKSKRLLPEAEGELEPLVEDLDTPRAVLSLLIEYLKFKQMATVLAEKEQLNKGSYPRGIQEEYQPSKKLLGIEKLSVEHLQEMFQEVLKRTDLSRRVIHEEEWRVSDKIKYLKSLLAKGEPISFYELIEATRSRVELIVTFLATLELMKLGEMAVTQDLLNKTIWLKTNPFIGSKSG